MNLSTIEMTREEAEAALSEWGDAVKAQKCTPEDEAIAAGYRELAKGHKLIALSDTIRAGGEDELGRPRLGVAPAISDLVFLHRGRSGTVAFSDGMSIGALREAIIEATELGGAWGGNMHESKRVVLRVNGETFPLTTVSASFLSGRFVLVLDGPIGPDTPPTDGPARTVEVSDRTDRTDPDLP